MIVVLGILLGLLMIGGAIGLGIVLQMRAAPSAPGGAPSPALSPAPSAGGWSEQAGSIRAAGHRAFLMVQRDEGQGMLRGLGPQVPLFFVDVRAEGDALVFDYLPGMARASRRIAVPSEAAVTLADRLRARFGLPRTRSLQDVAYDALQQSPAAFHGEVVRVRGPWGNHFESSSFAGLWMSPPEDRHDRGQEIVEVIGLVLWSGAARGHGHLGIWQGEIVPFEISVVQG
jgi:hypothetical protein